MLRSLPEEVLNNLDHFDCKNGDIKPNEKATKEEIKALEDFNNKEANLENSMVEIIE